MKAEAVLLDNDGILVSTEHLYFDATRAVLRDAGIEISERDYIRHLLVESRGVWHLAKTEGATREDIARMRHERNALYDEMLRTEHIVIDGVAEALERLRRRYRLAVVTASDAGHFETIHARTKFLDYFEFAVTAAHYTRSKPDPEPYQVALAQMGIPADRCLAVEDSERGVESATRAGLRCIAVPHGMSRATRFERAHHVASSLAEVCDMLGV